jgi:thiol-disulfide isomerase/thioredoxin
VAWLLLDGCAAGPKVVDYRAADLATGEAVSTASLRGSPALLVSWTTWCTECDEVLSGLQGFASSAAAEGVLVVAVNLDAGDVEDRIAEKLTKHGVETRLWRDRQNDFRAAFGALGVPTVVLLDAHGSLSAVLPGAVDFDSAEFHAALDAARGLSAS